MLTVREIEKFELEMKRLGVSKVARSKEGFLAAYKEAGTYSKLPDYWKRKQSGFIARHMAQYKKNPTYRRRLALIAWGFDPESNKQPKIGYNNRSRQTNMRITPRTPRIS